MKPKQMDAIVMADDVMAVLLSKTNKNCLLWERFYQGSDAPMGEKPSRR